MGSDAWKLSVSDVNHCVIPCQTAHIVLSSRELLLIKSISSWSLSLFIGVLGFAGILSTLQCCIQINHAFTRYKMVASDYSLAILTRKSLEYIERHGPDITGSPHRGRRRHTLELA